MSTDTLPTGRWQRLRQLFDVLGPETGVWSTRLTRGQHLASALGALLLVAMMIVAVLWQGGDEGLWQTTVYTLVAMATAAAMQGLALLFDRQRSPVPSTRAFAGWSVASLVVGQGVGLLAVAGLELWRGFGNEDGRLAPEDVPLIVIAFGVLFSGYRLLYVRQWLHRLEAEQARREAAEQGRLVAEAQLKMLQAQIEPHFLFNTLASVQYLVRKDAAVAEFLVAQLIRYLREAMPQMRSESSTLAREFALVEAYLNILRLRMGARLQVQLDLPPALADTRFPPLLLHTLVENAVHHGVEPQPGPVQIQIRARLAGDSLELSVQDDGVGLDAAAPTAGGGVGLSNIRARLAALHGDAARLDLVGVLPRGTCATVRVPRQPA